jgi:hypothetical protein
VFGIGALALEAADAEPDEPVTFDVDGNITSGGTFELVPGLQANLVVPSDAITVIMSSGGLTTSAGSAEEYTAADIGLSIDGRPINGFTRVAAQPPSGLASWNLHSALPLSAGAHTIAVKARPVLGSVDGSVSGVMSPTRGTLTVMFLKR